MKSSNDVVELIGKNIPLSFIEALENHPKWSADTAWRDIMMPRGIGSAPTDTESKRIELDTLRRNRRALGNKAILAASAEVGAPRRYISVGGGHRAAFVQFGRVIVAIEPTDYIGQLPPVSEHRIDLASNHSDHLRQLEFRFTDEPVNRLDPRGATYLIIQHGVSLASLNKPDCMLGHMALIVPTSDLKGLVVSANIMGEGYRKRFIDPYEAAGATGSKLVDAVHPKVRSARKKKSGRDHG